MTLKTRKFLFYTLSILFLVVATVILLYSRGTIVDWKTLRLVQTGGIYIESDPPDAEILLQGKPIKNTVGLLQAGTFINNLFPGRYEIILSKAGYQAWQKEAEVLPSQVAVFDRVILVKDKEGQKIRETLSDFYESEGRIIVKNGLKLTNDDKALIGDEVLRFSVSGSVVTRNSKTGNYYLSNLSNLNSSLNLSLIFNNLRESVLNLRGAVKMNKIYPYPYNDKKFVVKTTRGLYAMDTERLNLELLSANAGEFALGKSQVFYLEDNELWTYNLPLRTKLKLTTVPLKEKVSRMEVSADGSLLIFLEDNGRLTVLNKDSGTVRLVADKVREFALSPNSKLIAFLDYDGPLNVYSIEKENYLKSKADLRNIQNLTWYRDNFHLLLQADNNLYFLEVDERKPQNIYVIAKQIKKFIYDKSLNQVYFSNSGGLFNLEI